MFVIILDYYVCHHSLKKNIKEKNSSVLIKYPYYHSKASFEPEKNNKTKYVPHSIVTILSKFFVCL